MDWEVRREWLRSSREGLDEPRHDVVFGPHRRRLQTGVEAPLPITADKTNELRGRHESSGQKDGQEHG